MSGSMVQFAANGHTCDGYLSLPPGGSGPGLIVIQEWWGLVDHIKTLCDRFAAEGFVALAPDMYHGEKTTSPDQAGKLLMALNIAEAGKDMRGAAEYLRAQPRRHAEEGRDPRVLHGGTAGAVRRPGASRRHRRGGGFLRDPPQGADRARKGEGAGAGPLRDARQGDAARISARARRWRQEGRRHFDVHEYEADHAFFNDTRPQVSTPLRRRLRSRERWRSCGRSSARRLSASTRTRGGACAREPSKRAR